MNTKKKIDTDATYNLRRVPDNQVRKTLVFIDCELERSEKEKDNNSLYNDLKELLVFTILLIILFDADTQRVEVISYKTAINSRSNKTQKCVL